MMIESLIVEAAFVGLEALAREGKRLTPEGREAMITSLQRQSRMAVERGSETFREAVAERRAELAQEAQREEIEERREAREQEARA